MSRAESYAGDSAWSEWFDRCSVTRCESENRAALTDQIRSAMFAQLFRFGYGADLVGDDDPVTFFDSYFLAHGSRETEKPIKSYFRWRMSAEDVRLREFVCGTLFSAKFGRIHDIVRDWIASVKGWRAHSLVGADGKRHIVWESAAPDEDARAHSGAYVCNFASRLDRTVLRGYAASMVDHVAMKLRLDRTVVAFLFFASARGLAISSPEVLARLGVRKSRACRMKEDCMRAAERFFADKEVEMTDLALAEAILFVCRAICRKETDGVRS